MVWRKEETLGEKAMPSERWCHTAVLFGKSILVLPRISILPFISAHLPSPTHGAPIFPPLHTLCSHYSSSHLDTSCTSYPLSPFYDFNKGMFVFGGSNDRRRDAQVYCLDLETMTWDRPAIDGAGPQARQLHSMSSPLSSSFLSSRTPLFFSTTATVPPANPSLCSCLCYRTMYDNIWGVGTTY